MIRHICMFKLRDEGREELIREFFERTEALREIPEIKGFSVVRNDPGAPGDNYDVSLVFDLESLEDLDKYQNDPRHKAFGAWLAGVRTGRACIDHAL